MTGPKTAMILAAGLGLRMRPLTDAIPKAMIEIRGKPLIGYLLEQLENAGVETVVVNVHYKADPLVEYLDKRKDLGIVISNETGRILETGGGVKKALDSFGGNPFFTANCDSFFHSKDPNPFTILTEAWQSSNEALLLVKDRVSAVGYDGRGDFFLNQGVPERRGDHKEAPFVFTGVQILHPSLFEGIEDEVFSLNKIYDTALIRGTLAATPYPAPWYHVGTPAALKIAEGACQ